MGDRPLTVAQLASALAIGSLASLVLGLMPVLLAGLVAEARIDEPAVGSLVTVELLAIALGSVLGTRLLARLPAPLVAVVGGVSTAAANLASIACEQLPELLLSRGLAGLAQGCLMSLALVAIARDGRPERASGLFLAVQTLLQLVAVQLASQLTLGESHVDTCLLMLAAGALIAAALAPTVPRRLRLPAASAESGRPGTASLIGLVAAGAFMGATLCVWGYLGLWILRSGLPVAVEADAVALSLGAQVAGALLAARLGGRLSNRAWIVGASLGQVAVVLLMLAGTPSREAVYGLAAGFGFLWLFAVPAFTGLLIELDPTRRAATLIVAAQLGGAAALPLLGGRIVADAGVGGALWLAVATFVLTILLVIALRVRARPPLNSPAPLR